MLVNRAELVGILLCAALGGPIGCGGQEPAATAPMPTFATPTAEPRTGRASTRKTRADLARLLADARKARDVVRVQCLNDKLVQVDVALQSLRDRQGQRNKPAERVLQQRIGQLGAEANQCIGEELAFVGETKVTTVVDPSLPTDDDVGLGTGGNAPLAAKTAAPSSSPPAPAPAPAPAPSSHSPRPSSVSDDPQIAFTATLEMAVFQVDPSLAEIQKIALDLGGHLATRGDGEITVRVPRPRFVDALARIEGLGDVTHREIAAENVTDQVVELGMRLRNAVALRARLEQLLEKASTKDALEIEKELARVTTDIEGLEGKLKQLSHRVAYASITVDLERKQPRQVAAPNALPFPWLDDLGLPTLLNVKR